MHLGVLKDVEDPLVAITPTVARKLINDGFEVTIEQKAGIDSLYNDIEYKEAGAKIDERDNVLSSSDILVTVSNLKDQDFTSSNDESLIIGKFNTRSDEQLKEKLTSAKQKVFSLDLIPRTSIAQSMDVISSLASLAGYKAVIEAANRFPGYLPMMTTAAGTVPPAKVLILGAGVAGLQAIATARRLGAVVEAFDVRKAVKEEVESLGAKFVDVDAGVDFESDTGYAKEQTEAFQVRQRQVIHEHAIKSDLIITTANIPGRKAPTLLEEDTVKGMMPGSVIVDMAAETGGNCVLTKNNEEVIYNGVTILGNSRLHNLLPKTASRLFSNNLYNYLKFMKKNGTLSFDHDIFIKTHLGDLPAVSSN